MNKFYRFAVYCIGLLLLALGIVLNSKTGLGVSPIISVPYSISVIFGMNLGNATLLIYMLCVLGQMALRGRSFRSFDLLQIPMSIAFSRVINVFNGMITVNFNDFVLNLFMLAAAIVLTGTGMAISVEMKLVPNAADGLAQAIGERLGKGLGLGKNILDVSCVLITLAIGLVFAGKVTGIGLGTLAAVLGVGRSAALFNLHYKEKMIALAS